MTKEERHRFHFDIGERIIRDNLDLTIIGRYRRNTRNKSKAYIIKCNKCGFNAIKMAYRCGKPIYYHIIENNLEMLSRCPCCYGRITQPGINDILTLSPEIVKYFANPKEAKIYTISANQYITCVCPDCGTIKNNQIQINQLNKLKRISCICSNTISLPERIMFNVLRCSVIGDNFIYQYRPKWCVYKYNDELKYGVYDFYFSYQQRKYLIEMDGAFHYEKHYRDHKVPQNIIDQNKDCLAKENGYELIRIDCRGTEFEYIKNSIQKTDIFNILGDIDWEQIEQKSSSNIGKKICDDYEAHKDMEKVMKYLEEKYHCSRGTILNHLRKGCKYGWCNYNNRPQWRKVYQFDMQGTLIKVYDSCSKAMNETGNTMINQILRGKIKQRPPYIWSYEPQFKFEGENND